MFDEYVYIHTYCPYISKYFQPQRKCRAKNHRLQKIPPTGSHWVFEAGRLDGLARRQTPTEETATGLGDLGERIGFWAVWIRI